MMDSELSFATILIWALIIQALILALVGLVLLHRRFRRSSTFNTQVGVPSAGRSGRKWLVSGLTGAVLVAAGIYYIILPEEQPWYEQYHPRTKPDVHMSEISQGDNEQGSEESPIADRAHRDLRSGEDGRAPRIRDATRRFLKGRPPAERKRFKTPDPVHHTYMSLIQNWHMKDRNQPGDEVLNADSVYDRLVKIYNFKGSQSTVRNFLANQPYSIPQGCGKSAVVDWITVPIVLQGKEKNPEFFFMKSEWSGKYFVYCYRCGNLESFLDAHIRAFDFFGGIFPALTYRNLSDRIRKMLGPVDSPEKQAFDRFCSFYDFHPEFQDLEEGPDLSADKGSLKDLLAKSLLSDAGFPDLDELNKTLLDRLAAHGSREMNDRMNAINKLYEQEKICLLSFPDEQFRNTTMIEKTVSPGAILMAGENRYKVPKAFAGRQVEVEFTYNRVDIFCDSTKIASYPRPCQETD